MAVEPQVQQFIDFIRDEMPRRIKTNPNNLPDAQKLLVSVSGTLEVIYKTLAELDIAIKSDVDTELSNKEPTIATGTTAQYIRGDKTLATLNADAVPETTNRVYLSPAQKTIATQAATATLSGYLSSTDWGTFNSKQAALADVITSNTYGNSTQWPIVTVNAKGIVTGITLQTVPTPTLTDATFSVQKNGSPSIAATWSLSALTTSHVHTYPNKDINFGDLPNVATTDSNTLSADHVRCRILGGQSNNVGGTGNVVINSMSAMLSTTTNTTFINSLWTLTGSQSGIVAIGVRNNFLQTQPLNDTIAIGSANNNDLFTYPVAACTVNNSLFASSDSVPVSGTLYATTNGSQTLSSDNCLPIPTNSGTAQYEVDFIVTVGAVGSASTACNATGCISMRRIFTVFKDNSGAAVISAVDTVGTDRTLGSISGTFTPTIALSGTTHVTVGITRAGGVAGQEAMAISCRVRAHLTR